MEEASKEQRPLSQDRGPVPPLSPIQDHGPVPLSPIQDRGPVPLSLDYKRSDVLLAMVICAMFLQDFPMSFREKVVLCVIFMRYMDLYIKSEADLIWVNKQIKKMEKEDYKEDVKVVTDGSDTTEWYRTGDE